MPGTQVLQINSATYTNSGIFEVYWVTVTASGDNVQCTLKDTAGIPFFQGESSISNDRHIHDYLGGQRVVGIKAGTWANIEAVLVGVKPMPA